VHQPPHPRLRLLRTRGRQPVQVASATVASGSDGVLMRDERTLWRRRGRQMRESRSWAVCGRASIPRPWACIAKSIKRAAKVE
jgi:hypothetical protein